MSYYVTVLKSDIFVPRERHKLVLKALQKKMPVVPESFRHMREYLPITRRNLIDELRFWFIEQTTFDEDYNLISIKFSGFFDIDTLFGVLAQHMTRDGEILVEGEDAVIYKYTFSKGQVEEHIESPERPKAVRRG